MFMMYLLSLLFFFSSAALLRRDYLKVIKIFVTVRLIYSLSMLSFEELCGVNDIR